MTAVVQARYGPDPEDVLAVRRVARPVAGPRDVLVRVHAASVDRGTWHVMAGLPYLVRLAGYGVRRPRRRDPGMSLAGVVESVGAEVTGLAPGEEVYGVGDSPFAEYCTAPARALARKPAGLSFAEAACLPISGLTALQAVRDHGRVRTGERVLVTGASGGVGSYAVQIAVALGAEVTGVCSGAKADWVRGLGAAHVVDHTRQEITDSGRRFDVVLDAGGHRPLSLLRRAMTPSGRLVIVGSETGGRWIGGTDRQLRAMLLSPFVRQRLRTFVSSENTADLDALRGLVESGRLHAALDRTFPLAESAAAIRYLVDGRARGKVAISVG